MNGNTPTPAGTPAPLQPQPQQIPPVNIPPVAPIAPASPDRNSKRNIIVWVAVIVVVLVAAGFGFWFWQKSSTAPTPETTGAPAANIPAPTPAPAPTPPKEDSTAAIEQDLNSVDVGNLDNEFQSIDADLNSL